MSPNTHFLRHQLKKVFHQNDNMKIRYGRDNGTCTRCVFFFFSLTHRNIFQLVLQLAVAMWPSSGQCVQAEVEYAPSTLLRRHPVLLQLSLLLFFFDCQADAEDAGKGIQMSAETHHRGSWFLQDVGAEPPHWPKSDMVMSVK